MDVSAILEDLNEAQRQAVTTSEQVVRVIAGAGSGKTRVLVRRMQWLMAVNGLSPFALLALTFTNKAAREMKERLEKALSFPLEPLWMGTFHSIGHRLLRRYAERMGWSKQFVVMDSQDQLALIKRLMRAQQWDEQVVAAKQMMWLINHFKDQGVRAADVEIGKHRNDVLVQAFYADYERACRAQATMDFSELLLLSVELLREHADVRERYQERFEAILVDEFQDTNALQFQMVALLKSKQAQLFVVGDDDQSIYAWRGAQVENILSLEKHYPQLCSLRLEQNYRSTQTILQAANAVIAQNSQRLGKTLWSAGEVGEKVRIYPAVNEYDEARFVCEEIMRWQRAGGRLDECAILYRSNAQSRVFEEMLVQHQMPYRVYGGLRFFERAEVKDALAYLRLAYFAQDDGALERVINTPARDIGAKTLAKLRELAKERGQSLWQTLNEAQLSKHFSARAVKALQGFISVVMALQEKIALSPSLAEALRYVVYDTGLHAMYDKEGKEEALTRQENLQELISAGEHFDWQAVGAENERLLDFLSFAALDAGEAQAHAGSDAVQMMTLHTAKGLEFDDVFLVGVEEGMFPSYRALESEQKIEEERRLAYVGMTRARRHLTLSFAEMRRFQGKELRPQASRFIYEIPQELTDSVRPMVYAGINQSLIDKRKSSYDERLPYQQGDSVEHAKFGEGCVLALEGDGEHLRVLVNFAQAGEKWLVAAYAKLQKI